MSLPGRLILVNVVLALALAAQWGLTKHLDQTGQLIYPALRKPISQLPLTLSAKGDGWVGQTNPHEEVIRNQLPFVPEDLVSRTYVSRTEPISLNLYMVYSKQGDDRKHHPEVCIRDVTGAPEDLEARKILYLSEDESRPIQRFRFRTSATQHTTVYYWHLTFPRIAHDGETDLQVLYQSVSKPPPSITIQVTTLAAMEQLPTIEKDFLVPLDQALRQGYLPAGTMMRCDRLPVALIRR